MSIENLRAAMALAENKRALEKRLRQAKFCLANELRPRFSSARFDYANKRLVGDGLALQWKPRHKPDAPEAYENQQTRCGIVVLVPL